MQSGLVERTPDRVLTLAESMSNTKINEAAGGALRIAAGAVTDRELAFGAVWKFGTTAEALALTEKQLESLPNGAIIQTAGRDTEGDGGGGQFIIEATGTANGGTVLELADGRYARMVNWTNDCRVFGVKGDGTTDDTTALQAAIDYCDANGLMLHIPEGLSCKITSGLTSDGGMAGFLMHGKLLVEAVAGTPVAAFDFNPGINVNVSYKRFKINVERSTFSDWASEDDVGALLRNVYFSQIELVAVVGFTIGVRCYGWGTGFVYNTIQGGRTANCKVGIDLYSNGSLAAGAGWCNQNTFIGNSFGDPGQSHPGSFRCGYRLLSGDATYGSYADNNIFLNPSFELWESSAGTDQAPGIYVQHGRSNRWYGCRFETASRPQFMNDSFDNHVEIAYSNIIQVPLYIDNSDYKQNSVKWTNKFPHEDNSKIIFAANDLGRQLTHYGIQSGSDYWMIPGLAMQASSSATIRPGISALARAQGGEVTVPASRGMLIRVHTTVAKRFLLKTDASTHPYLNVKCYDGQMQELTGASPKYAVGSISAGLTWTAGSFGGCYRSGNHIEHGSFSFAVHDDVEWMDVILSDCTIRNWTLLAGQEYRLEGTMHPLDLPSERIAISTPVLGTYVRGDKVWHAEAAAGTTPGWVCVTSGTFSTANGVTASTTSGSASITVNYGFRLAVGQSIRIAGVTGTKVIDGISGSTVTLDSTCDATVSNAAVTREYGLTANTTIGSTTVTVNSAADLHVGDYIAIAGVSGTKKIVGISGTTVYIDSTADATVSDAALTFVAPVFKAMANLSA